MALRWMYDASVPPPGPPGLYACGGYIGGDTPHVWTPAEWASQPASFRLPIFTASNREDNACAAGEDAWEIRAALAALGVAEHCTVAVDIETRVYSTYLRALNIYLAPRPLMTYGSLSTLLRNPVTSGGRWAADWTGDVDTAQDEIGLSEIHAFQWANSQQSGRPWDLSLIDQAVPLWPR
jgi:hypothetical protein